MPKPYYDKNGIMIYCGDCLEVMPRLSIIFDAIIADLPYGTTACSWDEVIPFEPLWDNYKRLIKKNGAVVLFGSQPFTSKLVMSNLEWFKYCWYWEKSKGANFSAIQWQPLKVIEEITIFSEGGVTYTNGAEGNIIFNPQKIPLKNPYKRDFRGNKSKSETTFLRNQNAGIVEYTEKMPRNLLYSSTDGDGRTHPTQKPVALLSYLIRTYTNPGEIILDNTMGSGTTLVAAQNEGRRAVGIELNEEYCKIAVERLRQPSFFSIAEKPKNGTIGKQLELIKNA